MHQRRSRWFHMFNFYTMVDCNLRQYKLQQGEHLKKRRNKLCSPTWQKQVGLDA